METFDISLIWDSSEEEIIHPEDIIGSKGLEYLQELYELADEYYQGLPYESDDSQMIIEEILEEWLDTSEPYL